MDKPHIKLDFNVHQTEKQMQFLIVQMLQQRAEDITLTRTIITGEPHIKMDSNAYQQRARNICSSSKNVMFQI